MSSFAVPSSSSNRRLSKRKRQLDEDISGDGPNDQPTSRDASGII